MKNTAKKGGQSDPVFELIAAEKMRQKEGLELIPSEIMFQRRYF